MSQASARYAGAASEIANDSIGWWPNRRMPMRKPRKCPGAQTSWLTWLGLIRI